VWFIGSEYLMGLKGGYNWMISNEWMLSMGAHATYANDDYMDTYGPFAVLPR
jgi:outer membrane scaffolding protein for murein synthesis (MipA/OmpV family)